MLNNLKTSWVDKFDVAIVFSMEIQCCTTKQVFKLFMFMWICPVLSPDRSQPKRESGKELAKYSGFVFQR